MIGENKALIDVFKNTVSLSCLWTSTVTPHEADVTHQEILLAAHNQTLLHTNMNISPVLMYTLTVLAC